MSCSPHRRGAKPPPGAHHPATPCASPVPAPRPLQDCPSLCHRYDHSTTQGQSHTCAPVTGMWGPRGTAEARTARQRARLRRSYASLAGRAASSRCLAEAHGVCCVRPGLAGPPPARPRPRPDLRHVHRAGPCHPENAPGGLVLRRGAYGLHLGVCARRQRARNGGEKKPRPSISVSACQMMK